MVYVTHDREEAFAMSDRIGVLRAGALLQAGDPRALYETPADTFVARFFGDSLLLPVEAVLAEGEGTARVQVLGRSLTVRRAAALGGGPARLVVRPGQMRLSPAEDHLSVAAEIVDLVYLGDTTQLRCQSPGVGQILARVDPRAAADLQPGQQVRLGFAPGETVCVPDR